MSDDEIRKPRRSRSGNIIARPPDWVRIPAVLCVAEHDVRLAENVRERLKGALELLVVHDGSGLKALPGEITAASIVALGTDAGMGAKSTFENADKSWPWVDLLWFAQQSLPVVPARPRGPMQRVELWRRPCFDDADRLAADLAARFIEAHEHRVEQVAAGRAAARYYGFGPRALKGAKVPVLIRLHVPHKQWGRHIDVERHEADKEWTARFLSRRVMGKVGVGDRTELVSRILGYEPDWESRDPASPTAET